MRILTLRFFYKEFSFRFDVERQKTTATDVVGVDLGVKNLIPDSTPGFDRIEWGVRAQNALEDLMVDVDVLIKTQSDVETFKIVPASLTRKIVKEGKLLYGQGKTHTGAILA